MKQVPAHITALIKYYEQFESTLIQDYKKTKTGEFLLVAHVEEIEHGIFEPVEYSFYKADKHTGKHSGYIGSELVTLRRKDISVADFTATAKTLFTGL